MFRRGGEQRQLATVLFTDIVGSTERAAELGDRRWREVIAEHHAILRRSLKANSGREVDTAGDGFFTTFESPAQAIACATEAIAEVRRRLSIEIRAGVHTGEVERSGSKVGGIAVHIGARVLALAGPGEVVVTSTVRELAGGSGHRFVDRGTHDLKGVPEPWHLYTLEIQPAPEAEVQHLASATARAPAARQRRTLAIGLATGVAAVAIVGIGFIALSGATAPPPTASPSPAQSPSLVAGPNAAIELDSEGQQVGGQVVGSGPDDVIVGGGSVWVANLGSSTITRIDPAGGTQTTIGGVGRPSGLAYEAGEERLWVLDGLGAKLSIVDARTGQVLESFRQSGRGIASGAGAIWIADEVGDAVVLVDPVSRQLAATIALPTGSAPVAVATTDDMVWVAAKGASSVYRIDPVGRALVGGPTMVIAPPTDIEAGPSGVWVASGPGDALIRLEAADGRIAQTTTAICDEPGGVAVGTEGAWLTCRRDATVIRFATSGGVVGTIDVGFVPNDVALDGDTAWVTLAAE